MSSSPIFQTNPGQMRQVLQEGTIAARIAHNPRHIKRNPREEHEGRPEYATIP